MFLIISFILSCLAVVVKGEILGSTVVSAENSEGVEADVSYSLENGNEEINNDSVTKDEIMDTLAKSDKEKEIIDNIGEYIVCNRVYQKDINSERSGYLSEELLNELNNRGLIDNVFECPYKCEEYNEYGDCIHREEMMESGEWEPVVKVSYNQDEMIDWRNGKVAVKDANAGLISYNVYDLGSMSGKGGDILYVAKFVCDNASEQINARAIYNIYDEKITSIKY